MSKIYIITWEFLGEPRVLQTRSFTEALFKLNELDGDHYVLPQSISIQTEIIMPVTASNEVTEQALDPRETEYQQFQKRTGGN